MIVKKLKYSKYDKYYKLKLKTKWEAKQAPVY